MFAMQEGNQRMTVGEMIEELSKYDGKTIVNIFDSETNHISTFPCIVHYDNEITLCACPDVRVVHEKLGIE
jgi:hypothetical protein